MGFQTTIIVNNDALQDIAKDKDFGPKIAKASSAYHCSGNTGVDCQSFSLAAEVVAVHHADANYPVILGNLTIEHISKYPLHPMDNPRHSHAQATMEPKEVKWLRAIADTLGYSIRKRPNT